MTAGRPPSDDDVGPQPRLAQQVRDGLGAAVHPRLVGLADRDAGDADEGLEVAPDPRQLASDRRPELGEALRVQAGAGVVRAGRHGSAG